MQNLQTVGLVVSLTYLPNEFYCASFTHDCYLFIFKQQSLCQSQKINPGKEK